MFGRGENRTGLGIFQSGSHIAAPGAGVRAGPRCPSSGRGPVGRSRGENRAGTSLRGTCVTARHLCVLYSTELTLNRTDLGQLETLVLGRAMWQISTYPWPAARGGGVEGRRRGECFATKQQPQVEGPGIPISSGGVGIGTHNEAAWAREGDDGGEREGLVPDQCCQADATGHLVRDEWYTMQLERAWHAGRCGGMAAVEHQPAFRGMRLTPMPTAASSSHAGASRPTG